MAADPSDLSNDAADTPLPPRPTLVRSERARPRVRQVLGRANRCDRIENGFEPLSSRFRREGKHLSAGRSKKNKKKKRS